MSAFSHSSYSEGKTSIVVKSTKEPDCLGQALALPLIIYKPLIGQPLCLSLFTYKVEIIIPPTIVGMMCLLNACKMHSMVSGTCRYYENVS